MIIFWGIACLLNIKQFFIPLQTPIYIIKEERNSRSKRSDSRRKVKKCTSCVYPSSKSKLDKNICQILQEFKL
jgi:Zn-finger protein